MNVLVITQKCNGNLVAVVEVVSSLSNGATALAWAKATGHARFPKDLLARSASLTSFGNVMRNLTPCNELLELEAHKPEVL